MADKVNFYLRNATQNIKLTKKSTVTLWNRLSWGKKKPHHLPLAGSKQNLCLMKFLYKKRILLLKVDV